MNVSHLDVIGYREDQLQKLFDAVETKPISLMINSGERRYDVSRKLIFNDTAWKGYFPVGQVLNEIASRIQQSFKKQFFKEGDAIKGVTSDSDFFIRAGNLLSEVELGQPEGRLRPGKYILLKYTDLQWSAFYDIFKVISDRLLIGKVFLGEYPTGRELFTFPMVREYPFEEMTVEDHRELFERLAVTPEPALIEGVWDMTAIANSNHRQDVARLAFDVKPDGKIEGRYNFLGTFEGQMETVLGEEQLRLIDFTPLQDDIRAIDANTMVGKWVTRDRQPFGPFSLGLLQAEPAEDGGSRFGFYYLLKRSDAARLPTPALIDKVLARRLHCGLTFEEQMDGAYYSGDQDRQPEHLLGLDPKAGKVCKFGVRMTIADLDQFVDGAEHRAELSGTLELQEFRGDKNLTLSLEPGSFFNYLILNPQSQEHEMRYHLRFRHRGELFALSGTKLMQKDHKRRIREILDDYTTLFARITAEPSGVVEGVALLKFRTFEDLVAVGSTVRFGLSFKVTGADNPATEAAAIAKFNALTTRFVLDEYNPLGL